MGSASGKGAVLGMADWTDDDLITDVERPTPSAALVVNDWFWGGQAPPATLIPWTWLSMPLSLRTDPPINSTTITQAGGADVTASVAASQAAYGSFPATATLNTILAADARNFGQWIVNYYANPLVRCPVWTLDMTQRLADEEKWRILGREIGDRVTLAPSVITDPATGQKITLPVPAGLPPGALSVIIAGITHTSSVTSRLVTWTMAPLLGSTPGVEGPWFRLDYSRTDGTDVLPF